jgi:hypothetical protein
MRGLRASLSARRGQTNTHGVCAKRSTGERRKARGERRFFRGGHISARKKSRYHSDLRPVRRKLVSRRVHIVERFVSILGAAKSNVVRTRPLVSSYEFGQRAGISIQSARQRESNRRFHRHQNHLRPASRAWSSSVRRTRSMGFSLASGS